jgi:hypothetical protein
VFGVLRQQGRAGSAEKLTCTWQSISPGISVRPPPSITLRGACRARAGPDSARMRVAGHQHLVVFQPAPGAHVEHVDVLEQGQAHGMGWRCNGVQRVADNHAMPSSS